MKIKILFYFLPLSTLLANEPYIVFLKKGSLLINKKDHSERILENGAFAKVLEQDEKTRKVFDVYDNSGKVVYETTSYSIEEIEKDIKLLPNLDASIKNLPLIKAREHEKNYTLQLEPNIYFENFDSSIFENLYNTTTAKSPSIKYNFSIGLITEYPIEFLLGINNQNIIFQDENNDYHLNIFGIHALSKYKLFSNNYYTLKFFLSAELHTSTKVTYKDFEDDFDSHSFNIGLENYFITNLFNYKIGINLNKKNLQLKKLFQEQSSFHSTEFTSTNLSFFAGLNYTWKN